MSTWTLDESWTEDEVIEQQLAYKKAGGKPSPNCPMSWWMGKRRLRELEQRCTPTPYKIEDVPMAEVMDAIELCAMHEWPIPQWAAQPFRLAVMRLRSYEARSWDQVLGPFVKLPKNAKLPALRRKLELQFVVYQEIEDELRKPGGLRIGGKNACALEEVGRRHGIKKTLASDYYYEYKERMDRIRPQGVKASRARKLPRK